MRLFTFGCSYTEYIWPTWSDIVAKDLGCENHNYGKAGMGNQGIACRLVEANRKHSFQTEDIICIVWSSWTRVDLLKDEKWMTEGNILNSDYYSNEYLQKHWSVENDDIRNETAILQGNAYIKQFTQDIFNGHITSVPNHLPGSNNIFPKTKCVYQDDAHPSVLEHMDYVENTIYPSLGYHLKQSTKDWCSNMEITIQQLKGENSRMSNLELEDLILEHWEGRKSYV
jgi:hypothetical protein